MTKPPSPNPVEVYLSGLSSRNERTAREALDLMARQIDWKGVRKRDRAKLDGTQVPWWELKTDDVVELHRDLAAGEWISEITGEPYNATTINRFIGTLRGVLRQCWKDGLMPVDVYLDSVAKLRSIPSRVQR